MTMAGVVLCMEEYMMILLGRFGCGFLGWFWGGGRVRCRFGWVGDSGEGAIMAR